MIKLRTGILWMSVMLLPLTGCKHMTGELTYFRDPLAESVEVVEYIKPEIRKDLVEVDQVKCELGANYRTLEANVTSCYNLMANIAADQGCCYVLCERYKQVISPGLPGETSCNSINGIVSCRNSAVPEGYTNIVKYTCEIYKKKKSSSPKGQVMVDSSSLPEG